MTNTINQQEFCDTMEANKDKLHFMKLKYLALEITNEEVKQKFFKAREKVLLENEFFAEPEKAERFALRTNETITRILNPDDLFLMTDEDFKNYNSTLCVAECYKQGLTKADECYTDETNTQNKLWDYKEEIIQFQLSLLPDDLKGDITEGIKGDFTTREKFFNLIMGFKEGK